MSEHKGSTSKINSVNLETSIERVVWSSGIAAAGENVNLLISTNFTGNNSEIKIDISDKSGKVFETIKSKISGNDFRIQVKIPDKAKDELYAEVKLPKHGLSKKSNPIHIYPIIQLKNLKWDKSEARRGDILKLTADVLNIYEGAEAEIQIWEYDPDNIHDLITKFPVIVRNKNIEAQWEYEYHEDTDAIPSADETESGYRYPEYFFRIVIGNISAESALLRFKDFIELKLEDQSGKPVKEARYNAVLPDGQLIEGKLDGEGYVKIENIPPGRVKVVFPEMKGADRIFE